MIVYISIFQSAREVADALDSAHGAFPIEGICSIPVKVWIAINTCKCTHDPSFAFGSVPLRLGNQSIAILTSSPLFGTLHIVFLSF